MVADLAAMGLAVELGYVEEEVVHHFLPGPLVVEESEDPAVVEYR